MYLTVDYGLFYKEVIEIFLNSHYKIIIGKWYVLWEKTCNFKWKGLRVSHIINIFTQSTWYWEIRIYQFGTMFEILASACLLCASVLHWSNEDNIFFFFLSALCCQWPFQNSGCVMQFYNLPLHVSSYSLYYL